MSDEEDSNASQEEGEEEENEEEGEGEGEEDAEGEENEEDGEENEEDGEGEEDEDAEGEENEDDEEEDEDDDKKKKKKKGKKDKDKDKDKKDKDKEKDKDKDSKEKDKDIKPNTSANDSSNLLPSSNNVIFPQRPQSVLSILEEINNDLNSLHHELTSIFPKPTYTSSYSLPYSQPIHHDVNKENEEIKKLIAQANSLASEIDNNLKKSRPQSIDKCVGNDEEENNIDNNNNNIDNNYQSPSEPYTPLYTTEPQAHRNYSPQQSNSPYDWNRNIDYYNALNNRNRNRTAQYNNNSNNPFIQQPESYHAMNSTGSHHYQSSRVKKMDDLYSVDGLSKRPIIYTQERNSNNNNNGNSGYDYNYNPNLNENQKNSGGYEYNNNDNNKDNDNNQVRPFERYKPKSISQAMDILLDKQ